MTTQAKRFITPGDIVAIRMDCTACGASLSVQLTGSIRVDRLLGCPNCNEPWLKLPSGANLDLQVRNCVAALNELVQKLTGKEYSGFNLCLEIQDDGQGSGVSQHQ
jgi:hypothetical protein